MKNLKSKLTMGAAALMFLAQSCGIGKNINYASNQDNDLQKTEVVSEQKISPDSLYMNHEFPIEFALNTEEQKQLAKKLWPNSYGQTIDLGQAYFTPVTDSTYNMNVVGLRIGDVELSKKDAKVIFKKAITVMNENDLNRDSICAPCEEAKEKFQDYLDANTIDNRLGLGVGGEMNFGDFGSAFTPSAIISYKLNDNLSLVGRASLPISDYNIAETSETESLRQDAPMKTFYIETLTQKDAQVAQTFANKYSAGMEFNIKDGLKLGVLANTRNSDIEVSNSSEQLSKKVYSYFDNSYQGDENASLIPKNTATETYSGAYYGLDATLSKEFKNGFEVGVSGGVAIPSGDLTKVPEFNGQNISAGNIYNAGVFVKYNF